MVPDSLGTFVWFLEKYVRKIILRKEPDARFIFFQYYFLQFYETVHLRDEIEPLHITHYTFFISNPILRLLSKCPNQASKVLWSIYRGARLLKLFDTFKFRDGSKFIAYQGLDHRKKQTGRRRPFSKKSRVTDNLYLPSHWTEVGWQRLLFRKKLGREDFFTI